MVKLVVLLLSVVHLFSEQIERLPVLILEYDRLVSTLQFAFTVVIDPVTVEPLGIGLLCRNALVRSLHIGDSGEQ